MVACAGVQGRGQGSRLVVQGYVKFQCSNLVPRGWNWIGIVGIGVILSSATIPSVSKVVPSLEQKLEFSKSCYESIAWRNKSITKSSGIPKFQFFLVKAPAKSILKSKSISAAASSNVF